METWGFNWRKRLRGAAWPLGIAAALAALTLLFAPWGSWRFWVGWAFVAVALLRAGGYLYWARRTVQIDARGITRSGRTMPFHSAELELRAVERASGLVVTELVLWGPRDADGKREGVGFDDSLEGFERAVRTVVARVPEMRIVVSTVSEPNITDARREAVLAPLRPTPAERALAELGHAGRLSTPTNRPS
ncbi:MAG: hypothetical protein IRZ16_03205 [Myxococcaceae bacterium]|nr:hypothetical protein [Myxococcaceae bacterium]